MAQVNPTLLMAYLTLMKAISKYLSRKYMERTLDDPAHFKAITIRKIVHMFETFDMLAREKQDKASSLCVLRAILDSVAIYSFIYERDDDEVMFRYYLYAIDGIKSYNQHVINGIMEISDETRNISEICKATISQLKDKLLSLPYSRLDNPNISKIIQRSNWKYESLQNPDEVKFKYMYERLGFDSSLVNYYQNYLSQFVHGLLLSNVLISDIQQMNRVVYISIPIADAFIRTIFKTFDYEDLMTHCLCPDKIKQFIESEDFNFGSLLNYVQALVNNDTTIYI